MYSRQNRFLILIAILIVLALWTDFNKNISLINPFNDKLIFSRNVDTRTGLDLRGGLQVLLEADLPPGAAIGAEDLRVTRQILENRSNALGVSEVVMQTAGERRIVAEFPGISNPEEVIASLQQTGLLEFVDMGTSPAAEGTIVQTDFATSAADQPSATPRTNKTAIGGETATPEAEITPTVNETIIPTNEAAATPQTDVTATPPATVYHTVMTGASLDTVRVTQDQLGRNQIAFTLKSDASKLFADYTGSHINQYLAIVLDKRVISTPVIHDKIGDGQGVISGSFSRQSANTLAIQLRYGSLPIPMKVIESQTVGPTLGEESVHKSILAGVIGLAIVVLFMAIYYRLPGFLADLALVCYALFILMLFKMIPVVLTLPGIAGFILSIGMAVDANILIFERLKEELRAGRNLRQAIDLGWSRAWPSIRDSNFSTLITCGILFWFGSAFGASLVKGFSLTLALGVGVSLFTAIIVTRTFLHLVLDNIKFTEHPRWFGI